MRTTRVCTAVLLCAVGVSPTQGKEAGSYGLEQLKAIARSTHPTLESMQATIEQTEAIRHNGQRLADPELHISFGRAESGPVSGSEEFFELTQEIELAGFRKWRRQAADSAISRTRFDRLAAMAVIDSTVARRYTNALLARERVRITRESETLARELADLLQRRVDVGESPPLDALKARTELYALMQTEIDAKSRSDTARAALNAICAFTLGSDFTLRGSLLDESPVLHTDDLSARLDSNPMILAARAAVEEVEASWERERASSVRAIAVSVSHESELDKDATSIGVGLRIPLWNRNRSGIAATGAAVNRARADVRSLQLGLRTELDSAVNRYAAAKESVGLFDDGWRESAREAVEIARFSFENGEISLLELLDAQRSQLVVQFAEARARASLALIRFEIDALLGNSSNEEDEP